MPDQEIIPTPDGGFALAPIAPPVPANLRKSYFADEEGEGVYHFAIRLDNKRVYCRELSETALDDYLEKQNSIAGRNQALRANPGAPEAESIARGLLAEQRALALEVLQKTVVGWDLPVPFLAGAVGRLSMAARIQLATKVVQASTSGEDAVPLASGS
ncbi:hypothetical protein IAD21_00690 [Abditibacteriota bacterium]|nr:hypothetical protein IAD21_00690 [Abditibacteriota bacterium]